MGRLTGRLLAVGLAGLALTVSGCSSDEDTPAPDDAGRSLAAWMEQTGDELTDGVQPLQAWTASRTADADESAGCEDGAVRRTYAATVAVPDSKSPDPGLRGTLLVGQLGSAGWDAAAPTTSPSGGSVTAVRSDPDGSGTKLTLRFATTSGGWSYDVTARTACLSAG